MNHRRRGLLEPFRLAAHGVLDAAVSQPHMRVHLVAAALVATFGCAFPLGVAEQLALLSSIFLVVAAEVLNTALEASVDLAAEGRDERARRAKDAAAGFVLALAVGAVAAFALVVGRNWALLRWGWRQALGPLALGLVLAGLSGCLVFPFRRPRWLDWLAALGGTAALAMLALASRSLVFASVAGLVLGVCALAAFARRTRPADRAGGAKGTAVLHLPAGGADDRPDGISPAAPPPRRPAR